MIVNTVLTALAVVLGYFTLGLPGALLAPVAVGLVAAYDAHKRRVEQSEAATYPARPGPLQHQHFGD